MKKTYGILEFDASLPLECDEYHESLVVIKSSIVLRDLRNLRTCVCPACALRVPYVPRVLDAYVVCHVFYYYCTFYRYYSMFSVVWTRMCSAFTLCVRCALRLRAFWSAYVCCDVLSSWHTASSTYDIPVCTQTQEKKGEGVLSENLLRFPRRSCVFTFLRLVHHRKITAHPKDLVITTHHGKPGCVHWD